MHQAGSGCGNAFLLDSKGGQAVNDGLALGQVAAADVLLRAAGRRAARVRARARVVGGDKVVVGAGLLRVPDARGDVKGQ